jgi:O-acetyl-ADP-ribose deacetylase (regulator of RNase III)
LPEFNVDGCVVVVKLGDITQIEADAIVNPANSWLVMGGGVAGAIKRSGGSEIEKRAIQKAPIPVGDAVATTAGRLRARYVIHAPTMPQPAMSTSASNVAKATMAALRKASELRLESIAIPGMGTGVGGVPVHMAAGTMIDVVRQHVHEGTSLKRILLVSIDESLTSAFESVLR